MQARSQMNADYEKYRESGRRARSYGAKAKDCPFAKGSIARREWLKGFRLPVA